MGKATTKSGKIVGYDWDTKPPKLTIRFKLQESDSDSWADRNHDEQELVAPADMKEAEAIAKMKAGGYHSWIVKDDAELIGSV